MSTLHPQIVRHVRKLNGRKNSEGRKIWGCGKCGASDVILILSKMAKIWAKTQRRGQPATLENSGREASRSKEKLDLENPVRVSQQNVPEQLGSHVVGAQSWRWRVLGMHSEMDSGIWLWRVLGCRDFSFYSGRNEELMGGFKQRHDSHDQFQGSYL